MAAFSHRISLVSKARALAGALQLLRVLVHAVVADYRGAEDIPTTVRRNNSFSRSDDETLEGRRRRSLERNQSAFSSADRLKDVFTYQSRAAGESRDVGHDLMQALLTFLVDQHQTKLFPELYDCYCLVQQLVLVLLSTQLYEPFRSSFCEDELDGAAPLKGQRRPSERYHFWKPCLRQSHLASVLLHSIVQRQVPPAKSIQQHHTYLSHQVAEASGTTAKRGPDGLYETHTIVQANSRPTPDETDSTSSNQQNGQTLAKHPSTQSPILDATKGVLVLSSSILLLPFRLVSLALGLLGGGSGSHASRDGRRTRMTNNNDVLWLTDSPLADLSTALLLLLVNGFRSHNPHVVRSELTLLSDNRWETSLPDLPSTTEDDALLGSFRSTASMQQPATTAVNFEALFSTLGSTTHTEAGALWLYTLLQSSQAFAESVAVRSDLDTLVLPLLRTLYFTTVARLYTTTNGSSTPFRSISQLYVTIILLLLFSQDPSFGADAFRRVMVPVVPWYKERNLKDISLGSVLLLTLLRCLSFVLYRQPDAFLLSNCCAVLMNISSSVQDLHDWAAMRLVDSTVSTLQRYVQLRRDMETNEDEDDITTPVGMYGEAARTLVCVLKQALSIKHIERNIHLVYALVYHQASLQQLLSQKGT